MKWIATWEDGRTAEYDATDMVAGGGAEWDLPVSIVREDYLATLEPAGTVVTTSMIVHQRAEGTYQHDAGLPTMASCPMCE